jgi:hypothetical protein
LETVALKCVIGLDGGRCPLRSLESLLVVGLVLVFLEVFGLFKDILEYLVLRFCS